MYIYDAGGVKLRKKSISKNRDTTVTDYCGELEFTSRDLNLIHTRGVVTFTRIMQRITMLAYCISAIEVRDSIRVNPESIVNSSVFGQSVNVATSVTIGSSGVFNSLLKSNSTNSNNNSSVIEEITPPILYISPDNTKVVKPQNF